MRGTSGTSQQLPAVATTKPAQPAAATQPTNAYNPRHPERTLLYRTVAEDAPAAATLNPFANLKALLKRDG